MLKNGQTYFKKFVVSIHTTRFLKYVWLFFHIMDESVKQEL